MTAADIEVGHGYTMADLAVIARRGLGMARTASGYVTDRYQAAWDGAVMALYEADRPPTDTELILAAARAVELARTEVRRDLGLSSLGAAAPRFDAYWRDLTAPTPSPEGRVVQRLALTQIWPRLRDTDRQALAALATAGDYQSAAAMLGITYQAFGNRIRNARTRYLALWHEGETPSRLWRADKRDRKTPQWENKNRTAMLRRNTAVGRREPKVAHGTWGRYVYYSCRCDECKRAASEHNRAYNARRRACGGDPAGTAERYEHGTRSRYRHGCRCEPCRHAERDYTRDYRARKKAEAA